jgi:cellulose synthase/poly-beta-1,6-N-acetylglucosamine synthase-like glycosyltransferase
MTILWLSFLYLSEEEKLPELKELPKVSIVIPAYNEGTTIEDTIHSVAALDYPRKLLEIFVVNDGSVDQTKEVAQKAAENYPNVQVINKKNEGKSVAVNTAIEMATGSIFGCVDADSTVEPHSLRKMLVHFKRKRVGAVISAIQVKKTDNIYEKVQRFEYMLGILTRKLMAKIDTLAMTPGVLSLYRTDILRNLGGFEKETNTEDFEIAMRLKYHGYTVELEPEAATYTKVPNSFRLLWHQRIRWFRGFFENNFRYRKMMFNKKYGAFGYFQMPFNFLAVAILIAGTAVIIYGTVSTSYDFIRKSLMIQGYFMTHLFSHTTPKLYLMSQNMKIMVPIWISAALGIYMIYYAHKLVRQKVRHPLSLILYFTVFPYLTTVHWLASAFHETFRTKKKW